MPPRSEFSDIRAGTGRRGLIALTLLAGVVAGCTTDGLRGVNSSTAIDPTAKSATSNYLSGQIALQEGEMDEASIRLNEALKIDPSNVALIRQVFFVDISTGRFESALGHARELVELEPSMQEPHLLIGLDHARNGNYVEAMERFEDIDERGIVGLAAPLMRGWSLFGAGDIDAALSQFEEQGNTAGLELLTSYHRGLALMLAGRTADAVPILDTVVSDELDPVRVITATAEARRRAGNLPGAVALVEGELAFVPENVILQQARADLLADQPIVLAVRDAPSAMADGLLGLARAVDRRRSDPRGIMLGQMAAMLDPEAGDIQLFLASSFLSQDRPQAAINTLASLPADTPWTWEGRLLRAEALFREDRTSDAISLLEDMADERPERTDALLSLGDILRRDEQYRRAERAYSRAFDRLDELTESNWRLLYSRGITYERTNRWPLAEADFLKALELAPDQPLVLNYLGYSWVDQGLNLEEAEAMLVKAVELRPTDGYIVDSLGWAYYRLERFDEAVTYLEQAVELQPGDPVINDHLGDAYWRTGRKREARFQWERALTFGAESDVVAEIERKLERGLPPNDNGRG